MIYTYREQYIIRPTGQWTGHITSYFNKYFDFKAIRPLLVEFNDEKTIGIIKEINDYFSPENKISKEEYYKSIIAKTYNTIYECIEEGNVRNAIYIEENELKEFEGEEDIILYHQKLKEVNDFNEKQSELMYKFLVSKNAIQDYLDYHNGRNSMFREISKTLSKVL